MADEVERVAALVHEAWMASKREHSVTSRLSESGEELMVPYDRLTEQAKDLDRVTVRTVLGAAGRAGLLAAPVDGDLREGLISALHILGRYRSRSAAVDDILPVIAAYAAERERAAQHRLLNWLASAGQGRIKGDLLEHAESAIEGGGV